MERERRGKISRREFAGRAAVISGTAALAPGALLPLGASSAVGAAGDVVAPPQAAQSGTALTGASAAEASARLQQIFAMYGDRLSDDDKALVKKMNTDLQPSLDRIRAYALQNGDAPALYLKPLVEREKKPVNKTGNVAGATPAGKS
jgi:hypothetical protein